MKILGKIIIGILSVIGTITVVVLLIAYVMYINSPEYKKYQYELDRYNKLIDGEKVSPRLTEYKEPELPDIKNLSVVNQDNGCHAYVEVTPKESGFENYLRVRFIWENDNKIIHMMHWNINHPVANQTEIVEGWWSGHNCYGEADNIRVRVDKRGTF